MWIVVDCGCGKIDLVTFLKIHVFKILNKQV